MRGRRFEGLGGTLRVSVDINFGSDYWVPPEARGLTQRKSWVPLEKVLQGIYRGYYRGIWGLGFRAQQKNWGSRLGV